jgi:hypothetical protein
MLLEEQMSQKDAWSLRHTLQNEPRLLLLATATSRFGAIVDEEQALYEMFATYTLEPLDLAECRALWEAVGGVEADARRVRPMQILTGGNPRLLGILGRAVQQEAVGASRAFSSGMPLARRARPVRAPRARNPPNGRRSAASALNDETGASGCRRQCTARWGAACGAVGRVVPSCSFISTRHGDEPHGGRRASIRSRW